MVWMGRDILGRTTVASQPFPSSPRLEITSTFPHLPVHQNKWFSTQRDRDETKPTQSRNKSKAAASSRLRSLHRALKNCVQVPRRTRAKCSSSFCCSCFGSFLSSLTRGGLCVVVFMWLFPSPCFSTSLSPACRRVHHHISRTTCRAWASKRFPKNLE